VVELFYIKLEKRGLASIWKLYPIYICQLFEIRLFENHALTVQCIFRNNKAKGNTASVYLKNLEIK